MSSVPPGAGSAEMRRVQRADVRDQVLQRGAVGVEAGDDVLRAADQAVGVDQQPGVRRLRQRLRPPGRGARARPCPAAARSVTPAAMAGSRRRRRTTSEVRAAPAIATPAVSRPGGTTALRRSSLTWFDHAGQPDRVGGQRPGALLVDPLQRDVEAQRAVVDVDGRAHPSGGTATAAPPPVGPEGEGRVERPDGGGDAAEEQDGDDGADERRRRRGAPSDRPPARGAATATAARRSGRCRWSRPRSARSPRPRYRAAGAPVGRKIQRRATNRTRPMAAGDRGDQRRSAARPVRERGGVAASRGRALVASRPDERRRRRPPTGR